jgi:UDP-N-acetylmuramate--alanine ligase
MNFDAIKNIHFVGIGGIGMSGIAEVLADRGLTVSGCDVKASAATDLVASRGIEVSTNGHDPSHLDGVDAIVVTSAVKGSNPEIDAARKRGIQVIKRKEILGALVNEKRAVGVAGTHGKTTTSAMISVILEEAGLDPTILIGGMLRNIGSNAKNGDSDLLVVEADEYDRTFHELKPEIAVITNIEADHLEYYGSFEAIEEAFAVFASGVRKVIVACVDDPPVARLLKTLEGGARSVVTYGLSDLADVRAVKVEFDERGSSFEVPGIGFFRLFVPGEHNVRNALAAISVADELGVAPQTTAAALSKFLGVDRRFQVLGQYAGAIIVYDYAHHPTEIRATLNAARKGYPNRRVVALFQPHLYSRTRDFAREFGESLLIADVALVAPIYAAREQPLEGISSRLISDAAPGVEFLEGSNDRIVAMMRDRLQENDVFIAMGAGDVHQIAEALVG